MNRIDGYLIVESDLCYQDLVKRNVINPIRTSIDEINFFVPNESLFFKETEDFEPYRELIGSKICKQLKINHVSYDLLRFITLDKDIKGVVSKDYREKGYKTYTINDIIEDYENEYPEIINNPMSLDYLWTIFEYRYSNYPNKDKIVKNMMIDLVDYFLLDQLIGNIDHGVFNCEIMENDVDAKCCPYFDFGLSFYYRSTRFSVDDTVGNEILNNVKRFLDISSSEFNNRFYNMYYFLTPDKLEEIFFEVENDIGVEMPFSFKNITLLAYSKNYEDIGKIIKKYKSR